MSHEVRRTKVGLLHWERLTQHVCFVKSVRVTDGNGIGISLSPVPRGRRLQGYKGTSQIKATTMSASIWVLDCTALPCTVGEIERWCVRQLPV